MFTKLYHVFNADQIDGLAESYHRRRAGPRPRDRAGRQAGGLLRGNRSYHRHQRRPARLHPNPVADRIHMPPVGTFESAGAYYATLAHEATHWTGHGSRLDRIKKFADRKAYAFEELVAELGNVIPLHPPRAHPGFPSRALPMSKLAQGAEGGQAGDLSRRG